MPNFVSTGRKGFQMTFENGLTISVQWGLTDYCDNKIYEFHGLHDYVCNEKKDMTSNTAEVSIFTQDNIFIHPILLRQTNLTIDDLDGIPSVLGWQTPEEVLDLMNIVRNLSKETVDQMVAETRTINASIAEKLVGFLNKINK